MVECSFTNYVVASSNPVAATQTSDIETVSSKEFLYIQATIECKFTLKHLNDIITTYSPIRNTDMYSQHSSIILPVWLNG